MRGAASEPGLILIIIIIIIIIYFIFKTLHANKLPSLFAGLNNIANNYCFSHTVYKRAN